MQAHLLPGPLADSKPCCRGREKRPGPVMALTSDLLTHASANAPLGANAGTALGQPGATDGLINQAPALKRLQAPWERPSSWVFLQQALPAGSLPPACSLQGRLGPDLRRLREQQPSLGGKAPGENEDARPVTWPRRLGRHPGLPCREHSPLGALWAAAPCPGPYWDLASFPSEATVVGGPPFGV